MTASVSAPIAESPLIGLVPLVSWTAGRNRLAVGVGIISPVCCLFGNQRSSLEVQEDRRSEQMAQRSDVNCWVGYEYRGMRFTMESAEHLSSP